MKLSWKAGGLYFLLTQVYVLVIGLFLSAPFAILARFLFEDPFVQELMEVVFFLVLDLAVRFIVFYAYFRNNRSLSLLQFSIDYSLTIGLRLIFSLCTFFAFWSAGATISLCGVFLAKNLINPDTVTMQQVPTWLYLIVFFVFECLVYLVEFIAHKIASAKREKERKELIE
ncbi:MAG: hypothetical protein IJ004_05870 [Clostridia bacterium]|nr:hypothetical protein [Clostridia bacterium]